MNLDHIHLEHGDMMRAPKEPGRPETGIRDFRIQGINYSQGTVEYKEFSEELTSEGWVTRQESLQTFRHMVRGFFPSDWQYTQVPRGKDFLFTEEALRTQLCGQLNYFQAELYHLETPDNKSVLIWANHMPYMYVRKTAWKALVQVAAANDDYNMSGILYQGSFCLDLPILRMLRQMPVSGGNAK